jgi:hypothetical protein
MMARGRGVVPLCIAIFITCRVVLRTHRRNKAWGKKFIGFSLQFLRFEIFSVRTNGHQKEDL